MRRVALVDALAAMAAAAIVVAAARPSSSSVEARPFPPAAQELDVAPDANGTVCYADLDDGSTLTCARLRPC